jgi:hypothetical protein
MHIRERIAGFLMTEVINPMGEFHYSSLLEEPDRSYIKQLRVRNNCNALMTAYSM